MSGESVSVEHLVEPPVEYFTTDQLGTPVVATDGNQDELWVNRFDPLRG